MQSANFMKAHRFGFNGMETDKELYGEGNAYTTFFRAYDSRIAQWTSIDPDLRELPQWSAYQAMNRNPISLVDPLGNQAGKTYDKETGELIHDDGIDDKKVYLGTKSDGSDREDGFGNLNEPFAMESDLQDVTEKFNSQLSKTTQYWLDRRVAIEENTKDFTLGFGKEIAKNIEFLVSVAPNGVDDLKHNSNSEFYHPENVLTTRGIYFKGHAFYNGKLKRFDDFGNMNFGAAGRGIGFSLKYLNDGAALAQFLDNKLGDSPAIGPNGGDEIRDSININLGYALGGSWMAGSLVKKQ